MHTEVLQATPAAKKVMDLRRHEKARFKLIFLLFSALLLCMFFLALTIGRYPVSLAESFKIVYTLFVSWTDGVPVLSYIFPHIEQTWPDTMQVVIHKLRLPRTIAAVLIGGGLALSGAAYQSMFRNPLISPDLLGVSSGACIGASLAILMGLGAVVIQSWAFMGGLIAVVLTTAIPRIIRNNSIVMLVLAGIIVGGLMSSAMGIIRFLADPETALAEMTYWAMGSLANVKLSLIKTTALPIIIPALVLLKMRYRLNVLSLGENEAKTLGVNIVHIRRLFIVCATLMTASAVCMAGTIGWVGLVIPHLGRMLMGPDNRKMLPVSIVMGAAFMVCIDIIARTLTSAELPISIITGVIGAPFYFYLLFKQRMTMR